ncbi:MAG: hypothetical protein KC516_03440 [Nanoarchaeota archaeon]|nr:hypothetical protein [Nanoarchaeota archaeon]
MNKRGQVTIFIIIAIIVVVLGILFFIFRDSLRINSTPNYVDEVSLFVQDCIEESGSSVIYEIGRNGGYFLGPEKSTSSGVPYYLYQGRDFMPSKEKIEREISQYFNLVLPLCVNNFEKFSDLEINYSRVQAITKILSDKVVISVNYPITIKKGEDSNYLKDFGDQEFLAEISKIYFSAGEIVEDMKEDPEICLSCLSNIALDNDLKIDIEQPSSSILIFKLRDENSKLGGSPFEFYFAIENEK